MASIDLTAAGWIVDGLKDSKNDLSILCGGRDGGRGLGLGHALLAAGRIESDNAGGLRFIARVVHGEFHTPPEQMERCRVLGVSRLERAQDDPDLAASSVVVTWAVEVERAIAVAPPGA